VPVLELAFVRDVPVLVRGPASSSGDFLVPVLELAFVPDVPVLVRGSASSSLGISWCSY
jgi:hypothetical protein